MATVKNVAARPGRRVSFHLAAPGACAVFVAGTFNDWSPTALPMCRTEAGDWVAEVLLAPGRHECNFVVDGAWCCGPDGEEPPSDGSPCVANPFGTMNRVIEVG